MASEEFLILRCLAQRGLALRDAAAGGGCLRRPVALIQPLGNWYSLEGRGRKHPRTPVRAAAAGGERRLSSGRAPGSALCAARG